MNALREAQVLLERAESAHETSEAKDGNAFYRGLGDRCYAQAAVYAAVAQAEALTKIAEVAEELLTLGALDRIAAAVVVSADGAGWLRVDGGNP